MDFFFLTLKEEVENLAIQIDESGGHKQEDVSKLKVDDVKT